MKVMLTALAAAVLLVSPATRAADIVFGDFETGLDGFIGREGSILSTSTAFGVTRGTQSLAVNRNGGGFWGLSSANVIAASRDDFLAASSVSFDMTLLASQLGDDGATFSGFAQANEFVINDFGGAFVQRNFLSGLATDSLNQRGGWNGVDGTRTLTWNLETYPAPPSSPGLTYKQHLINNPQITGVVFWVPVQAGGGNVSPNATFYFDNWRFSVPDPFVTGDFNFDGGVDASDIDPFVVAANEGDPFAGYIASSQAAFAALYPGQTLTAEIVNQIGDFNGDGGVDASDIDPFVVFANSGGGVSAIPEPAALGLLAPLGLLIARRRR